MASIRDIKTKLLHAVGRVQNQYAAHQVKAESDTAADANVAGSRAARDDEDGSYVGRTTPQFDAEDQQSGAEARSEAARKQG